MESEERAGLLVIGALAYVLVSGWTAFLYWALTDGHVDRQTEEAK